MSWTTGASCSRQSPTSCAPTRRYDANGWKSERSNCMNGKQYQAHGEVAVITLDNPPVNGLGHELRTRLVAGIDEAQADSAVKAIVITGAGAFFSGGADIREFNTPKAMAEPTLHTEIHTIHTSAMPVHTATN